MLFQFPNFTDLLKTVGVKVEEVKSSPLKAAPNGYEPTSPEARAALDALVKDSYAWFRGLVKKRRGMDDALLEKVADGRVFTGRQAIDLKLIDQLGDEKTAVAWLVAQKNVKSDLPVRDFKLAPRFGDMTFLRTAASVTLDALGLSAIARQIEQAGVVQAVGSARPGRHAGVVAARRRRIDVQSGSVPASSRTAGTAQRPASGTCHAISMRPKIDLAS